MCIYIITIEKTYFQKIIIIVYTSRKPLVHMKNKNNSRQKIKNKKIFLRKKMYEKKLFFSRKWYENTCRFFIRFESFSLRERCFEHRYTSDEYDDIREQKWTEYSYHAIGILYTHDPQTPPHEELSEIIGMTRIFPESCLNYFSCIIFVRTKFIHLTISDIFA